MATTVERNPRRDAIQLPSIEVLDIAGNPPLAASATILKGTFAINDAGVVKPMPSSGTPTAGSLLLGIAEDTYVETTGSDTLRRMCFLRGEFWIQAKTGDVPAATELKKLIYIGDNATVQKTTPGANALTVLCTGVSALETKVLVS